MKLKLPNQKLKISMMKHLKTMTTLCLLLGAYGMLQGQCTATKLNPANPVAVSPYNVPIVIATNSQAGQYAVISGMTTGETYTFSTDGAGDYLTIRDHSKPSIVLKQGKTPLTYTTTVDAVEMHIHLSSPTCGTDMVDRTSTVVCTSCPAQPPGRVGINTTSPSQTLDVNGNIKVGEDPTASNEAGTIKYNASEGDFQGFNGSQWMSLTNSSQVIPDNAIPIIGYAEIDIFESNTSLYRENLLFYSQDGSVSYGDSPPSGKKFIITSLTAHSNDNSSDRFDNSLTIERGATFLLSRNIRIYFGTNNTNSTGDNVHFESSNAPLAIMNDVDIAELRNANICEVWLRGWMIDE